ncbi:MAG: MBL fold metallo-hydrolase [Candidatus Marinimicrobia bacterium]|nr:MBL fold metallo-hydrolase [Candidatus Neomarinimicrobiota bacterium]
MERNDNYIKFLGTAGARYVVAKQIRASGGIFISLGGRNILLDPGPGSLVRCAKSKPTIDVTKINAIILTHAHIDHSNDVNVIIDAMTEGGLKKRGLLFAPEDCISGENNILFKYLKSYLNDIIILKPESTYFIDGIEFVTSIRLLHSVETYGIKFHFGDKMISFVADTAYFPQLIDSYRGSYMLIVNVVLYEKSKDKDIKHLCIDDVCKIIKEIKPEKTVLTHFGMTMIKAKPWEVANILSKELGREVIAASDGMTIEI